MADVKNLRAALETELKNLSEAVDAVSKDGIEVKDDNVSVDPKMYKAAAESRARVLELKGLIEATDEYKAISDWLTKPESDDARFAPAETKSFSDKFVSSQEFKDAVEGGTYRSKPVEYNVADVVKAAQFKAGEIHSGLYGYSRAHNIGTVATELPWVQPPQLRQRVRDLFPVNRTNSNLIEFFRVLEMANEGRGAAGMVADYTGGNFGLKPQSTIGFESDSAQVRTIAHWIAVHRSTLADKAQVRSVIDNQLMYGLALVEDDQLLNGSGTGEDLRGLLNTPGIQAYTAPADEIKSDSLRKAQTLSTLALFPATGYIIHPNDWQDVELQKDSATSNAYALVTNVAVGLQTRVWRLPVVESPSITEGTFLTGAFGQAAQVWDRERANIRLSDSHADFFVRNAVAILAEERLALTVTAPAAIIEGTFAA
jgi:HK97 family phage major capsid protein